MFRTMVFPPSIEYLNELSYRQLQTIAKRRRIPSNVKKEYLREAIYYSWCGDEDRVEQVLNTIKAERQNRHLTNQLISNYRQYRTTAAQRSLVPSLQSLEGVNLGKDLIVSLVNNQHEIEVQHNVRSFHPYKTRDQRFIKLERDMSDSQRFSRNVSSSHTIMDGRNSTKISHRNKGVKNKVTQTGRIKANFPVRKIQARPSEPILCDRVLRNRVYPIYSKFGQKQKPRHTDRDENVVTSSADFVVAKSLRQTLADSVEQYGMEYHNNVQEIEPLDFSVKKLRTQSDDVRSYQHHALMMYSEVSHSEIQEDSHRTAASIENTQVFYSETYQRSADNRGHLQPYNYRYLQPYYHKKIRIERRMSEFNPEPLAYGGPHVDANNNRHDGPQVDANNNRYGSPQVGANNNRYGGTQVDANNNRYGISQVDTNNNVRTYLPAKVDSGEWPDNYRQVEPRATEGQRQQMSLNQGEGLVMRQELEENGEAGEYLSCRQDLQIPDGGETPAYSGEVHDKMAVNIHGYVNESVTTYFMGPQSTDREKPDSTVDDGDGQRGMVYGYMTTVEPSIEEAEPMYEVATVTQLQTQQTEPSNVASYPLPSFVDIFRRYCKGTQIAKENSTETSPDSIEDVDGGTVCITASQLSQTETEPAPVRESASELESMACGSPWSDVGAAVTVGEPSWDDVLGLIQEQGDMTTEMDNIQCVCCDWNGGASNLEAHIREEHAEQIQTYTAMLRCTHAVPLGVLLRARRYTTLLQCYGRLLALVVLYRDPEWVSVGVAQVSPHGELPLVDSTLTLYNLVTGEPFTWAGPALRSNAIFHSNPTAHLRVPLSKLGLVPNSADVLLWNRELRTSSPDHRSVCGQSHFDHITFDVHVQLTC